MLEQQRRRAAVEHVEGRAGARVDLQEPPALALHEAIGAGQPRQPGLSREPKGGLRDLRHDRRRDRHRLVAAAGEGTGVAERPQRRGCLPLLGQRERFDAAPIGQNIQGEGAARHAGLEVVAGRSCPHRAGADMRTSAAADPLDEPSIPVRDRAGGDGRVRDREARAERGEAEGVLQRRDRLGGGAEKAVTGTDLGDQVRRALEAAAEDDSEFGPTCLLRQRCERRQHTGPVAAAGAEAAGQRAVRLGQRQRVLVAEQVEHERPQARPARGLRQRPAGLRGDQDRTALAVPGWVQNRACTVSG